MFILDSTKEYTWYSDWTRSWVYPSWRWPTIIFEFDATMGFSNFIKYKCYGADQVGFLAVSEDKVLMSLDELLKYYEEPVEIRLSSGTCPY